MLPSVVSGEIIMDHLRDGSWYWEAKSKDEVKFIVKATSLIPETLTHPGLYVWRKHYWAPTPLRGRYKFRERLQQGLEARQCSAADQQNAAEAEAEAGVVDKRNTAVGFCSYRPGGNHTESESWPRERVSPHLWLIDGESRHIKVVDSAESQPHILLPLATRGELPPLGGCVCTPVEVGACEKA